MGKLFKFIGWLVGILVVLVIAAVVLVPMFFDPNDYKDQITAKVKEATGRELAIGGDIGLSLFPWLGVELEKVELSNAAGFGERPFVAFEEAQVRVKLMPLLSKKVEVDRVVVSDLELHLAKAKDGRSNWEDLAGAEKKEEEKEKGKAPELEGLQVGGIVIKNAHLLWDDQSAGQRVDLKGLDITVGEIVPGNPVEVKIEADVDNAEPKVKAHLALDGTLSVDEAVQHVTLRPLHINVGSLEMEDGLRGNIDLKGGLDADLAAQIYKLEGFTVDADLKGGAVPGEGLKARLVAAIVADLAKETLRVDGLKLDADDLHLSGGIQAEKLLSKAAFNGQIAVAEFSPRKLMQKLGMEAPPTADQKVLARLALKTALSGTADSVALKGLDITLDDTRVKGGARVSHFAKPAIGFNLDVDAIDLDRYLPPPAKEKAKEPPAQPAAKAAEGELIPVETIRNLNVDGVIRIGKLTVNRIKAESVEVKIKAKGGKLTVDQKVSKFYNGSIDGKVVVDARGKTPKLHIVKRVRKIQAGPLVKDLAEQDRFDGFGSINADLTAAGQTVDAIKRTLNGKLDLRFENGAIKGFNVARLIREGKAKLKGKTLPPSNEANQTDFSELKASAAIRNGVLNNQDFLAKSPFLRVTGKGTVNLVGETLDYTATPVIVATSKGQGGAELEELKGVPVPIHLTGSWLKPDWSIDWKSVLTASQKAKLEEKKKELKAKVDKKVEEKKEKIQEKLQDKLKGGLKGLFN